MRLLARAKGHGPRLTAGFSFSKTHDQLQMGVMNRQIDDFRSAWGFSTKDSEPDDG